MATPALLRNERVTSVLEFNEIYAQCIARIDEALLDIGLTANEARILRQLDCAHGGSTAPWMCQALGMDAGQLSRELRNLKADGLTQDRREWYDEPHQAAMVAAMRELSVILVI